MFDKYINEIKEKPFIIAFVILSIFACVCYAYRFQPIYTADDEMFIYGSQIEVGFSKLSYWFHRDPRSIGPIMSTLFNDGTNGKNLVLFISLLGCAFCSLFFVRLGLNVKSIFWSILFAAPLFINTMMRVQFAYNIGVLRYTPLMFFVALAVAVVVNNKLKNILFTTLVLFVTTWDYQATMLFFVAGVFVLSCYYLIDNQDLEFKQMLINLLKQKIIPAVISLLSANIIYTLMIKTAFVMSAFMGATSVPTFSKVPIAVIYERLANVVNYMIYNLYPATLHNGRLIFLLMFLSFVISIFYLFKRQTIVKQMTLSILIILSLLLVYALINMGLVLADFGILLRMLNANAILLVFMLYTIHIAVANLAKIKKTYGFLLLVFVMQMGNQVVYYSYKQLLFNTAKKMHFNRMVNDVVTFMHQKGINKPMPVYVVGLSRDVPNFVDTKPSHKYLHDDNVNRYYFDQTHRYLHQFSILLGATNVIKAIDYDKVGYDKMFSACMNVYSDKTMHAWPFNNSMKIIDGVIYIKTKETTKLVRTVKRFCVDHMAFYKVEKNITPNKIRLRDGYYDLTK